MCRMLVCQMSRSSTVGAHQMWERRLQFGIPPHQFMIRLRVDRAKEMLAEGDLSIAEVASQTGFGSPIQLTRAFRRVVGTTPSAFRRDMI